MSESSAFANYSNTAQQLRNQVDQAGATQTQITDDAKNFEQQFLIGAALAAKVKAVDKFTSLLKKSKTIQSLKGKGEDAARKLAKSAQDRANGVAEDLANKIKGVAQPQAPPTLNPSASPDNLDLLKDVADKASTKVEQTTQALEDANNKMIDTRDAVRTAYETRDAAESVVESNSTRAVQQAGGRIRASQQIDDAVARKTLNDARTGVDKSEAAADAAEQERNNLADQLVQHKSDAEQAAQDVKNVVQSGTDAEAASAESAAANVSRVAKAAQDSEKALKIEKDLKIAKDVEDGSEATSEADPLGLVVAGIAAIATQIIGRKIKAHEEIMSGGVGANVIPNLSYSSTLGA